MGVRVTDDSEVRDFEILAAAKDVDESDLNTAAIRIGSTLDGLRALIDHYASSPNVLLVRAVAFPLARAPWEFEKIDAQLNELVLEFIRATGDTNDAGTLSSTATAVQGLIARQLLAPRTDDDRESLGGLLLRCLRHTDSNVRATGLQLMGHLSAKGQLRQVLSPAVESALRSQVALLAAQEEAEFADELAALRDFRDDRD